VVEPAPHPATLFDTVTRKLASSGVRYVRRTACKPDSSITPQIPASWLLDTLSKLAGIFPGSQVVFLGGSIAPRGGHSVLEPATAGVPIVVGPHMENFESIMRDFLAAQAVLQINGEGELLTAIRGLLLDPARAEELGDRAREVVRSKQGVARRVADHLWPLYYAAFLKGSRGRFARWMLARLASVWCSGGTLKRRRSERRAATRVRLPVPVISVGGITVGGSGKTPFTNYLASRLSDRGYRPAILTRGYGRRSPAQNLVFAPGAHVPAALTGDEAQIFLRTGVAPLGIGADRYTTAKVLLSEFPTTNTLLLDDGFQHFRLKRDFDVVLIDGLDPFGEEKPVPLGRLRESLEALQRAHAFVITRADDTLRYEAIARRLRDCNPKAAVFRTRFVARHWCDYGSGECFEELPASKVAAFCGLGNPQNFWNTLDSLGLEVVFRWAFEDHHRYKPVELQRIAHQAFLHGAEILVTTEKDRLNCPSNLDRAIAPLGLAWLEIDLELQEEAAFFELLDRQLRRVPTVEAP